MEREIGLGRPMYTHEEYIGMVLRGGGGTVMRQDPSVSEDREEDPRMLAFFDSLVQVCCCTVTV
ncbi:MAG: hypothetical protein GY696_21015 [Gammaproteobacteria bacterium]|nr:hypothetical protein [Gammaproteobacteria bacterium]